MAFDVFSHQCLQDLKRSSLKGPYGCPHASTLPVRGAGAFISVHLPVPAVSHESHTVHRPPAAHLPIPALSRELHPACTPQLPRSSNSVYLHDLLPISRFPGLLSRSLSDLSLVTDFCILSPSCVTKPSSLAVYKV